MSVFFLYPIYLFGLAAASLPVLIHLLNRRKLNRVRFPAVKFILLSQKRISRSYRLRHWLLLALRTFAVMFLALLLANPIFQTGAGLFAGGGPVALVILLDNSLSMKWSGDGDGFKQAKEAARLLITSLNEGDRAALVTTDVTGKEPLRLKTERDVLLKELDQVEISDGSANLEAALGKAYELLNAPAGQKEIRFITDMGLTGWDRFSLSSLKQYDPSIALKTIRIPSADKPLNATVREVRLASPSIGVNLPLNLEAVIANFGANDVKELLVQLSIDGQNKEQKLAAVPAKGETTVSFQTRVSSAGAHAGQIVLKKDRLAGNTAVNFSFDVQDKMRALVVDGDPQTSLVQSESFFLSRALNPAADQESSLFLPTVIIPEGLGAASLDSFNVIILCNVTSLGDAVVARLQNFVRQGGGLIIFSGDKLQAEQYNQTLGPFLPAQLRDKKFGAEASGEKIDKIDFSHPALRGFSDPLLLESLKSARVWGYTRAAAVGKSTLISLANGDPLVSEQKSGNGRVVFIATSADRDWTDLPLKTAYLPLIQSLASYLAGGKRGSIDGGIAVGSEKEIALPAAALGKTLRITKPNRLTADVSLAADKDRAVARFDGNDRAGIYRLNLPPGAEKENVPAIYAVNPPFLESRLEQISERELSEKLRPIKSEVIPVEALREGGKRTDLALPLLALLLVTLLLEGWLAQRF